VPIQHIRARLEDIGRGHFAPAADLELIRALIDDQDCDLEADVLPILAHLAAARPVGASAIRNLGAPWLIREILAAREQRLAGHRVEAPPPIRRAPAIEWDEFVGGYRAGLIEWNTARLGPSRASRGVAHRLRC
jgi:hypothetical protein